MSVGSKSSSYCTDGSLEPVPRQMSGCDHFNRDAVMNAGVTNKKPVDRAHYGWRTISTRRTGLCVNSDEVLVFHSGPAHLPPLSTTVSLFSHAHHPSISSSWLGRTVGTREAFLFFKVASISLLCVLTKV